MRLIGKIEKRNGFYNFILVKYINSQGKVEFLNEAETHFIAERTGLDDSSFISDAIRKKITIWHEYGDDEQVLDEYVDNDVELEWEIDLDQDHIRLNDSGVGFATINNYSYSDFKDFSESFKVFVESDEQIYSTLRAYLEERMRYLESKLNEYEIIQDTEASELSNEGKDFLNNLKLSSQKLSNTDANGEYKIQYGDIYTKPVETSLYMLKYGYAYRYLYLKMYEKALAMLNPDDDIYRVLSIGCGSKLDLIGMKLAINRIEGRDSYHYSYYGVDAEDWTDIENANCSLCLNEGAFNHKSIQDYLCDKDSVDANIIIFPYSLSELIDSKHSISRSELKLEGDPNEKITPWEYICEVLPGMITENKFVIMSVYRDKAFLQDQTEFNKLIDKFDDLYIKTPILVQNDEKAEEGNIYKDKTEEMDVLRGLNYGELGGAYGFSVVGAPGTIWELLNDKLKKIGGEKEMRTQPMLSSKYINYEIVLFERNIE